MSKIHKSADKRSRQDLELFILALIDRGVDTPYELMVKGALSQGATIPALARLENAGDVRKSETAPRRRTQYSLTRTGRGYLQDGWRRLFSVEPRAEIEIILRTASVARLMGEPNSSVKAYLIKAALLKKALAEAPNPRPALAASKPVDFYAKMKQVAESKRLAAESVALKKIAASLKK